MIIGYAWVSTDDQTLALQLDALKAAGCARIIEEHASGGSRSRPVLVKLLEQVTTGNCVVVTRPDRLARSLQHLREVIEILNARGAFFKSLNDLVDTASPQGRFSLQVLGRGRRTRAGADQGAHDRRPAGRQGAWQGGGKSSA